jgi:DNA-directed RNA polymerase specialized sigma24 family protein
MEAAALPLIRPAKRAQTRAGDRDAFIRLYEPDVNGLFDLLLRTSRDRREATAALDDALAHAWSEFRDEGAPLDVRGWLYGLTRDAALARPRRRRTNGDEREAFDYTRVNPNRLPDPTAAFDRELIELVWDEVRTYDREDYTLLDLHLRRDLSVREIAEQQDCALGAVAGRLSWLCDLLNEKISSVLLARRARHACAELDADLSPPEAIARAVRGHVRHCERCRETKRRFVPATEVFASLALMAAPPDLRERTARRFRALG